MDSGLRKTNHLYCKFEMGSHKSHYGVGRPGEEFQVSCLVEVFQLKSRTGCYGFFVGAFSDENPLVFPPKPEPTGRTSYRPKVCEKGLVSQEISEKTDNK